MRRLVLVRPAATFEAKKGLLEWCKEHRVGGDIGAEGMVMRIPDQETYSALLDASLGESVVLGTALEPNLRTIAEASAELDRRTATS